MIPEHSNDRKAMECHSTSIFKKSMVFFTTAIKKVKLDVRAMIAWWTLPYTLKSRDGRVTSMMSYDDRTITDKVIQRRRTTIAQLSYD